MALPQPESRQRERVGAHREGAATHQGRQLWRLLRLHSAHFPEASAGHSMGGMLCSMPGRRRLVNSTASLSTTPPAMSGRVLLVDDDKRQLAVLETRLADQGITTRLAND